MRAHRIPVSIKSWISRTDNMMGFCANVIRKGTAGENLRSLPGYVYLILWMYLRVIPRFRRNLSKVPRSIEAELLFAQSFSTDGISIRPAQVDSEIKRLLSLLEQFRPKTLLEIGTAGGGTLFLFCRTASTDSTIISIDLPGGKFGGGYPTWRIPLYLCFAAERQRIRLLRRDSKRFEAASEVKALLAGDRLDFLFIDGDHRYAGVKRDFQLYSPLVRPGGIIAFHDIVPGPEEYVGGVPRFWNEIKCSNCFSELVENWDQKGYGIGIIYKDTS